MGTQPERKENDRQEPYLAAAEQVSRLRGGNRRAVGVAAIVPHNAMADSLMDEISQFIEESTEAEVLDEVREIR